MTFRVYLEREHDAYAVKALTEQYPVKVELYGLTDLWHEVPTFVKDANSSLKGIKFKDLESLEKLLQAKTNSKWFKFTEWLRDKIDTIANNPVYGAGLK